MLKSHLKSKVLTKDSQEPLEDITQISIYNDGIHDFTVMGRVVVPKGVPFEASGSLTYFDFNLDEIVFSKENPIGNIATILYQKVILPKLTQQKTCS